MALCRPWRWSGRERKASTGRARDRLGVHPDFASAAQELQDREHAPVVGARLGQFELLEDLVHVALDRLDADDELLRDPRVRVALGDEAEHLALACTERRQCGVDAGLA